MEIEALDRPVKLLLNCRPQFIAISLRNAEAVSRQIAQQLDPAKPVAPMLARLVIISPPQQRMMACVKILADFCFQSLLEIGNATLLAAIASTAPKCYVKS